MSLISLDCETTGMDIYHGAAPFIVTTCQEKDGGYVNKFWEWDVDPLTRKVLGPEEDIKAIRLMLTFGPVIATQNGKFDVAALEMSGIVPNWKWGRTHDTLIAGHLLASNQPHGLDAMALTYLGVDIGPFEEKMREACVTARRIARSKFPEWHIAREGNPGMPGVKGSGGGKGEKDKVWKNDTWLPRLLAKELNYPPEHPWWTVTSEYANADSSVTLALWRFMERELHQRNLWAIYAERMKALPIAVEMEHRGVSGNGEHRDQLKQQLRVESDRLGRICTNIAKSYQYDLKLPKTSNNNSLIGFVFGTLKLPHVSYTDTGNPSFDKEAVEHYCTTLDPDTKPALFVRSLRDKRKRDTALSYLESYERFSLPYEVVKNDVRQKISSYWIIHPSLNPCGTWTLRWSSNHPNEQNISKQEGICPRCEGKKPDVQICDLCDFTGYVYRSLRYCYGPAPGREWWSMDAKNIELRIPFYESNEKELIDLFERPDDPPYYGSNHLLNFHTVYPDIWDREQQEVGVDKVGPHCKKKFAASWYQYCKNGGFAKQYGGQQKKVDATFHRDGAYNLLASRFANLEKLNQHYIRYAEKHGYVETLPDKCVNPLHGYPIMCTRTEYGKILPTVPLNYHVQSTAMWWTMVAMIQVDYYLKEVSKDTNEDYRITLQVHDELVMDFPYKEDKGNLTIAKEVQKIMASGGDRIGIPTPVGVEYHINNWAEGETVA